MTIRFGILAPADVHADGYIPICQRRGDIELVGIADDDAGWGDEASTRHDAPLLPTADLLDRVDAVAIFSTYATRERWFEAATAAGVDVLCELPIATNAADARSFVTACRDANVTLGMITPLRCGESIRRAKDLLEDGSVGDLSSIVERNRCAFRNRNVEGWTADPQHADGGSVVHHSEHTVDAARWLTDAEFEEVYAELGFQRGLAVDDVNVVSARLSDGTTFVTDTSWTTPDSDEFWGDCELDLIGTASTLSVDEYAEAFRSVRDGKDGGIEKHHFGASDTEALLADFLDAVETGRDPVANGVDGLRQVEVIEAIYESAERNEPVPVERVSVD
ncbi:Gfo/Idh/MocA family protein [Halomontanus rarus]|uniref:Gfo/Idh/MocA family protein n=1 Tax=Halomontanus rarus TaxID=3034020 RepID=UPI0023E8D769|nr:Gfo/Idh/MocA family oxidoreductase [Halovivax sp. TS33]